MMAKKKTALVLSGGGSRGAYEIGVWKALKGLRIRIDLVTGTSVGAINGALVAQRDLRIAEKLWRQLETDMIFDVDTSGLPPEDVLAYAKEIFLHGGAGTSGLEALLREYINERKIRSSHIDYGLVITEFPSFEAHFLYKGNIPDGQLIDHIMASASCFPAAQKYVIGDRKFIDGGYRDNLPVKMALDHKVDRIIAVDLQAAGVVDSDALERAASETEFHMIKSSEGLGNFLTFDKLNTAKLIRLGYLDTMRHFGKYDGHRYTFRKNSFTQHQLAGAESAAQCLGLDPCIIYDRRNIIRVIGCRLDKYDTEGFEFSPQELKSILSSIADGSMAEDLHIRVLLHIAKDLKEKQEKSTYMQPALFNMLKGEIRAANFLIKNNFI